MPAGGCHWGMQRIETFFKPSRQSSNNNNADADSDSDDDTDTDTDNDTDDDDDDDDDDDNDNGICSGIFTRWLFIHCFQIELEFTSVDFCGGRKSGELVEKPS